MNSPTTIALAELHRHGLHAEAARARLAARAGRARRRPPGLDWLRRIAGAGPQHGRTPPPEPAAVASTARSRSLGGLASLFAVDGPAPMRDRAPCVAYARPSPLPPTATTTGTTGVVGAHPTRQETS